MTNPTEPPAPVPDLDWEPKRARELGEQVLDVWEEFLERLPDLPVRRRFTSEEVREAVIREVPEEPLPIEELTEYLRDLVLERSTYPGHPRFMAYVSGAGTIPGAVADLLAAAINQNLGGWRLSPGATEIELHLARWFAARFGLPDTAGGLLTSGGAMANFVALKVARDLKAGFDVAETGLREGPALVLYACEEVHIVVDRAADMLGLGRQAVRHLPTDEGFRLRAEALEEAIAADRRAGRRPFAVVGSAGTVATGAIDPLERIAEICAAEDLWFHIDGAYGALGVLAADLRPRFAGLDLADSIAFDPHKWLYTPHSGGCIVFREWDSLVRSFGGHEPSYVYEDKERGGGGVDLGRIGPQFSRGFWALKVWLSLLAHGRKAYERRISHDAELARYLHARVTELAEFEPMAPVTLSICCFRYVPPDLPQGSGREEYLDALNERLMTELQLDGRAYCSNAVLRGRFVLRACIVNFRTEAEDVDALLDVAVEIGGTLDRELRPAGLR